MAWSNRQMRLFMVASRLCDWNERMRYMVMAHCGCRSRDRGDSHISGGPRPSVADPTNTNRDFERCMAVAESHALGMGLESRFPCAGGGSSWSDASRSHSSRIRWRIESDWQRAVRDHPAVFNAQGLAGFITRMTSRDDPAISEVAHPRALDECDEGQLYRIHEGLKAWIARVRRTAAFA